MFLFLNLLDILTSFCYGGVGGIDNEKKTEGLLAWVVQFMKSEELKDQSKKAKKHFTRSRKLDFFPLITVIFNTLRRSVQLELDDFRKRFLPEPLKITTYRKQSFSEARQKISPIAFVLLNDGFIERFYAENDYKTYKGFRLLAIDGSVLEIPNTPRMQDAYGFVTNHNKKLKIARALSSSLVDIENHMTISSTIGRYDASERDLAKINIEKSITLGNLHSEDLILFDRGYPSAEFILYLQSKGIRFLMRVSMAFFKEVLQTSTNDEIVQIEITKERAKAFKRQGSLIPVGTILKMRVIKVELPTGEIEILITDLTATELNYTESKVLYFKRWGIETNYDVLKNQWEIENFSGVTPTVIEQDFYATIFLGNMASLIEQDADEVLQADIANKNLKHEEYKINHNILVGKLKNNLIEILLEEDNTKKDQLYQQLIAEIAQNYCAVVKGRSYERKKDNKANKYANSKRGAL